MQQFAEWLNKKITGWLLFWMIWCASKLDFNVIIFPQEPDGIVRAVHFARDEICLERSMRAYFSERKLDGQ